MHVLLVVSVRFDQHFAMHRNSESAHRVRRDSTRRRAVLVSNYSKLLFYFRTHVLLVLCVEGKILDYFISGVF